MNKWFSKFTLLSFIAYFLLLVKGFKYCLTGLIKRQNGAWSLWLSFLGHMLLSVIVGMWIPMALISLLASFLPATLQSILTILLVYAIGVSGAIIINHWLQIKISDTEDTGTVHPS